ncbi:MAG: hypothetical protein J6S41_08095 [Clostridia bacterium]|nr:hypothetical protein [Clostridia bacterium]
MGMIRDAIEAKGLTVFAVSRICEVSELLIRMLDAGHVTHPNIAHRIAKALDLAPEQEELIIPEERRGKPLPEPEPVKRKEPPVRPVCPQKKPDSRPVLYSKPTTVLIDSDAVLAAMKRMGYTGRYLSNQTGHSDPWMGLCLKTGRMHRDDVARIARMLGVRTSDIIYRQEDRV